MCVETMSQRLQELESVLLDYNWAQKTVKIARTDYKQRRRGALQFRGSVAQAVSVAQLATITDGLGSDSADSSSSSSSNNSGSASDQGVSGEVGSSADSGVGHSQRRRSSQRSIKSEGGMRSARIPGDRNLAQHCTWLSDRLKESQDLATEWEDKYNELKTEGHERLTRTQDWEDKYNALKVAQVAQAAELERAADLEAALVSAREEAEAARRASMGTRSATDPDELAALIAEALAKDKADRAGIDREVQTYGTVEQTSRPNEDALDVCAQTVITKGAWGGGFYSLETSPGEMEAAMLEELEDLNACARSSWERTLQQIWQRYRPPQGSGNGWCKRNLFVRTLQEIRFRVKRLNELIEMATSLKRGEMQHMLDIVHILMESTLPDGNLEMRDLLFGRGLTQDNLTRSTGRTFARLERRWSKIATRMLNALLKDEDEIGLGAYRNRRAFMFGGGAGGGTIVVGAGSGGGLPAREKRYFSPPRKEFYENALEKSDLVESANVPAGRRVYLTLAGRTISPGAETRWQSSLLTRLMPEDLSPRSPRPRTEHYPVFPEQSTDRGRCKERGCGQGHEDDCVGQPGNAARAFGHVGAEPRREPPQPSFFKRSPEDARNGTLPSILGRAVPGFAGAPTSTGPASSGPAVDAAAESIAGYFTHSSKDVPHELRMGDEAVAMSFSGEDIPSLGEPMLYLPFGGEAANEIAARTSVGTSPSRDAPDVRAGAASASGTANAVKDITVNRRPKTAPLVTALQSTGGRRGRGECAAVSATVWLPDESGGALDASAHSVAVAPVRGGRHRVRAPKKPGSDMSTMRVGGSRNEPRSALRRSSQHTDLEEPQAEPMPSRLNVERLLQDARSHSAGNISRCPLEKARRQNCANVLDSSGPVPSWVYEQLEEKRTRPIGGRHTSNLIRPEPNEPRMPEQPRQHNRAMSAGRIRAITRCGNASSSMNFGGTGLAPCANGSETNDGGKPSGTASVRDFLAAGRKMAAPALT